MTLNSSLPIHALLTTVEQTVSNHLNSILKAEPGAGKSTQVPLHLMNANGLNGQKIIMLEPRRLAVRSLAAYLAKQLGEPVGQSIGYQVRNEKKCSAHTKVEIVTEGILIRRLQQDPELTGVGLVIFDEYHERSLEADLALALCLDSQSALREDLKLLVMSATLEDISLSRFLDNAPVIECPGRTYPVQQHYLESSIQNLGWTVFNSALLQTLKTAVDTHSGDCLVFLPGKGEILHAIKQASELFSPESYALIPLYGSLSPQQQNLALEADKQGRRKIIFTTNIAETSLTIEGIGIVVDSGQVRKVSYDASSGMTRMLTQKISQASAKQRAGRAGRLSAGHAYRIWTEAEHNARTEFEKAPVLTSDLTDLCLETSMWGVLNPYDLRWLTTPPLSHVEIAQTLLKTLGFLSHKGTLTTQGQQAIQLGLSARLAKVMLYSQSNLSMRVRLCDIAALLSDRDILKNSYTVNLEERIQALHAYKTAPSNKHPHIIHSVAKEALINSKNWQQRLKNLPQQKSCLSPIEFTTAQCIALAYPDRIAKRRSNHDNRYLLSNGKGTYLAENDALNEAEYLVVTNLDGQRRDGKVFMAMPISKLELEAVFEKQIVHESEIKFNVNKQRVEGLQAYKLGAITLSQKTIKDIPKQDAIKCIIQQLKQSKLADLPWHETTKSWLNRVNWLAQYHDDYLGYSKEDLLADFDNWCTPYLTSITQWSDLKKLDLLTLLQAKLGYRPLQILEQQAPTHYQSPSNKRVAIEYQKGKNPTISIQLQELFGEVTSPTIAFGNVKLSFELLSPARRPIQITSDLAHFWQSSYFDIAKEMRGKYPKHRWPEKPLEEKAGRSLQAHRQRHK